jgi:acyl carrier protein
VTFYALPASRARRQVKSKCHLSIQMSPQLPHCRPFFCRVCGATAVPERSQTADMPLCPACARLLRWLRNRLSEDSELRFSSISLASSFSDDLRIDSLSMMEFITDLEQESGVNISDDTVAEVQTVEDVVRYVRVHAEG